MSDMLFRSDRPDDFGRLWDTLTKICNAGPRCAPGGIAYAFALSAERGLRDDRSFILTREGKPVAGALLPISDVRDVCAVTMAGAYIDAPLMANASLREDVFRIVDEQAQDAGAEKTMIMLDALVPEPYNYLQEFGYLDTSTLTYIYDLAPHDLLSACRRNHMRSLKKILQDGRFSVIRIDAEHPDRTHHERYEMLHEKTSGRKTRSSRTFDLQYEQLLAGEADLFCVMMDGAPVAYGYFWHAGGKVLYASTSDDPDAGAEYPLNHLLTFSAMQHYKERGYAALLPGEPSSPSPQFDYFPDAKQLHIGLFKSGFPGAYRPLYRGIRYYKESAIEADIKRFGKEYSNALKTFESEHRHS